MSKEVGRTVRGLPFGTVVGLGLMLMAIVLVLQDLYLAAVVVAVLGAGLVWFSNTASKALTEWADHVPPSPHGLPVEVWTYGGPIEIEGEFARPSGIRALLGHLPEFTTRAGAERHDLHAALVADPTNPHDSSAVAIYMDGHHVGYLPAERGPHYASHVLQAQAQSTYYTVRASIWGAARKLGSSEQAVSGRVRLYLPEADELLPSNGLPMEPHVVVPTGHQVQVDQTEHHMDVLQAHVTPSASRPVAVVLRACTEQPSGERLVQVELDGRRVGVLTSEESKGLLPLVDHLEQCGRMPVARASVRDAASEVEVVLDVAKAEDDLDAWLADVDCRVDAERPPTEPRAPGGTRTRTPEGTGT